MRAALVGMKFRPPALDIVERLPDNTPLLLVREPGNVHDRNAIAVYIQLGFIPKARAAKLAPLLDAQTNLVGTIRGRFQYHPQWPQVDIDDDPNSPPAPEPPIEHLARPPGAPVELKQTIRDDSDDEIPF